MDYHHISPADASHDDALQADGAEPRAWQPGDPIPYHQPRFRTLWVPPAEDEVEQAGGDEAAVAAAPELAEAEAGAVEPARDVPGDVSLDAARQGAGGGYPSGFGRGWIPLERDIGIPGEESATHSFSVAPAEAGAYLTQRPDADRAREVESLDRPLPPGQEPGVYPERPACRPAEGQGRRDVALPGRGWTAERKVRFLDDLAGHGNVRLACGRVRISPEAAYRLRRRDFVFAEAWNAALVLARVQAEQVLADRALHGVEEPVWHRGELVGTRRRFDNRLLLAHLGRLDRLAEEPRAQERAGRFDELLALVAGESFPEDMADSRDGPRYEPDPLLPMERERYIAEAGERAGEEARGAAREAIAAEHDLVLDAYIPERALSPEQCEALDEIEWEANLRGREAAEAAYDAWLGCAEASGDLAASEGAGGEGVGPKDSGQAEPRYEVKSLDGAGALTAARPLRQPWRAAGAVLRPAPGERNGAAAERGGVFAQDTVHTVNFAGYAAFRASPLGRGGAVGRMGSVGLV